MLSPLQIHLQALTRIWPLFRTIPQAILANSKSSAHSANLNNLGVIAG
jgi:hypothetical protein